MFDDFIIGPQADEPGLNFWNDLPDDMDDLERMNEDA